LVPVEKDGNYGYCDRLSKARSKEDASTTARKSSRKGGHNVEYEEVDVGSDAEEREASMSGALRHRRSLPRYLQMRNDDDLPDNIETLAGREHGTPDARSRSIRPATAGKRPAIETARPQGRTDRQYSGRRSRQHIFGLASASRAKRPLIVYRGE
jgi:hypothetical protein